MQTLEWIQKIQQNMVEKEQFLSPYASRSESGIRFQPLVKEEIRPNYFHDIDRIIHSLSYTRYLNKTQVFSLLDNHQITTRMVHVQLVSKIARTIGRALKLNEDLIEACALGHDLGHVPFGHVGEAILNELSYQYDHTYFNHNVQSVRLLMYLENRGMGSNLTVQVLDGILCHNGEFALGEYHYQAKTKEQFLEEYQACYTKSEVVPHLIPMTLEGCVVRVSDMIGYLGRDIEDACLLGRLNRLDIPKEIRTILGDSNVTIINTLVLDLIEHSEGKPYLTFSKSVFEALKALKKFNYDTIYKHANSQNQLAYYRIMFQHLFSVYQMHLKTNAETESIFVDYLNQMSDSYLHTTSDTRKIIDYMAGMTDAYFMNQYHKYERMEVEETFD